jgi:hypothetical protein
MSLIVDEALLAVTFDGVAVGAKQSLEGVDLVEERVDVGVLFVAPDGRLGILSEIRIAR